MKKILFLLLTLSIALASQAASYDLKYNLKKGEVYNQHMISKMNMKMNVAGQDMNTNISMDMTMTYKVTEITDTIYSMEICYQNMSLKISLPTGDMNMNSEMGKAEDKISTMLSKMKNKPFNLKMTVKGKILEVTNMDKLFDEAMNDLPDMSEEAKQKAKEQLSQMVSEKSFKGNFEMSSAIFPPSAVKIGDKWKVKTELHSTVSGNIDSEYILKEVTNDYYLIVGTSVITSDDLAASTKMSGMDMKINMDGTMNSELKVNKTTGWLMNGTMQQQIKANIEMTANDKMPAGMKMDMTVTNEMTVSDK